MAIIAKSIVIPPPPEGLFPAILVDVIDLGMKPGFKGKGEVQKIRLVWQLDEVNPETGKRYQIRSMYTLSIGKKANLSKHLEAMLGITFTDDQRENGWDVERAIGANCQIQVGHDVKDGGTVYANIRAIVLPAPNAEPLQVKDYIRESQRSEQSNVNHGEDGSVPPIPDDDLPF